MKKNFLKFSLLLLTAIFLSSCEKDEIITDAKSNADTTSNSISTLKSKYVPLVNPEVFFGEWELKHIYYNNRDYSGDSTLWLFYKIKFNIDPTVYGYTTADIERVESKVNILYRHFAYWKVSGKNVVFYIAYMDAINIDTAIDNHYTLINYKVTNTTLECDVWDNSGPAYKYSRLMHCIYSKVKDY